MVFSRVDSMIFIYTNDSNGILPAGLLQIIEPLYRKIAVSTGHLRESSGAIFDIIHRWVLALVWMKSQSSKCLRRSNVFTRNLKSTQLCLFTTTATASRNLPRDTGLFTILSTPNGNSPLSAIISPKPVNMITGVSGAIALISTVS